MLVLVRVLCTFVAAELTGDQADLELCAEQPWLSCDLPRENISRRNTNVGAVLIQTDTPTQHVDLLFAKAGVGTGITAVRAVKACLDTFDKCIVGE